MFFTMIVGFAMDGYASVKPNVASMNDKLKS